MRHLLFLISFGIFSACALSQELLTNETIVRLSNAGITDEVIVQLIRTQPGHYDAAPDAIVTLKQAGVRDGVIAAIVKRENPATDATLYSRVDTAVSGSPEMASAPRAMAALKTNDDVTRRLYRVRSASDALVLEDGTPVTLRVVTASSSESAKLGDSVTLQVSRAVSVGGTVFIPRGARATGTIAAAKHKGDLGRGGSVRLAIDSVNLADGTQVPLRATREQNPAAGPNADSIAFSAGTRWASVPFLVLQGKDAVIPHGTPVIAYVDGDFSLAGANMALTSAPRPQQ